MGWAPAHVKGINILINNQYKYWFIELKEIEIEFLF